MLMGGNTQPRRRGESLEGGSGTVQTRDGSSCTRGELAFLGAPSSPQAQEKADHGQSCRKTASALASAWVK